MTFPCFCRYLEGSEDSEVKNPWKLKRSNTTTADVSGLSGSSLKPVKPLPRVKNGVFQALDAISDLPLPAPVSTRTSTTRRVPYRQNTKAWLEGGLGLVGDRLSRGKWG